MNGPFLSAKYFFSRFSWNEIDITATEDGMLVEVRVDMSKKKINLVQLWTYKVAKKVPNQQKKKKTIFQTKFAKITKTTDIICSNIVGFAQILSIQA